MTRAASLRSSRMITLASVAAVLLASALIAAPLMPYNQYNALHLSNVDDECSVGITGPFKFYGTTFGAVHVCTNGLIAFGGPNTGFSSESFPIVSKPMIAPYWCDVDTTPSGADGSNHVYYEIIPSTAPEATEFNNLVRSVYGGSFTATRIYLATWDRVGSYSAHPNPANTFQAAIVTDEDRYYAFLNYPSNGLNWVTSESAGFPQAGFNAGDGTNYFNLPNSQSANIVSIAQQSNIGIEGLWLFRIDSATFENPPTPAPATPTPVPATPSRSAVPATATPVPFTPNPSLLPYNKYNAGVFTNVDDACTEGLLGTYKFYGTTFSAVHVCTNGLIAFGGPNTGFSSQSFPILSAPMIAPYWCDVDTRPSGADGSNRVYYEMVPPATPEADTLNNFVRGAYDASFTATRTYLATWDRVGAYNSRPNPSNSFQAAILTNEDRYYAVLYYPSNGLNWVTSGSPGFPQAGFNAGDGTNFFNLPNSQSANIVNVAHESNIGVPGVWLFRIDSATFENPPTPSAVPATASVTPGMPETVLVYRNVHGKSLTLGAQMAASGEEVAISQPDCSPTHMAPSGRCGKVYIVGTSPQGWTLRHYFQFLGRVPGSRFGTALALRDGWLIATSTAPNVPGQPDASAVYGFQFVPSAGRYVRRFSIAAPMPQENLHFGAAVATAENFTFIAAPGANHPDGGPMGAGAVLVYHYPKSIHMASGGKYHVAVSPNPQYNEGFGRSVAAAYSTLIVSSGADSVYAFYYNLDGVYHYQTISAPPMAYGFGKSLFFDGMKLFVGAPMDSNTASGNGAVGLFVRDASGAFAPSTLFRADTTGVTGHGFGSSIHYNGMGRLVVSATGNDWCVGTDCNQKDFAYVFNYDYGTNNWYQTDKMGYGATDGSDRFGHAVVQTPFGIVVSAPEDHTAGQNRGAVYFIQY